jgi:lysophospholipase L1-like esterase
MPKTFIGQAGDLGFPVYFPSAAQPQGVPRGSTAFVDQPIPILLATQDLTGGGLTYTITEDPLHGDITGTPPDITYTPLAEPGPPYVGLDSLKFESTNGVDTSLEQTQYIDIIESLPAAPNVDGVFIMANGDSITAGPTSNTTYLTYLLADPRFSSVLRSLNFAAFGAGVSKLDTYYSYEFTVRPTLSRTPTYLTLMIGTNNIAVGMPPATIYAAIVKYLSQAIYDGFYPILMTLTPAIGHGSQTDRDDLNALILASPYPVFDAAAVLPDPSDLTYYSDGLHPTAAGNMLLGTALADFITSL